MVLDACYYCNGPYALMNAISLVSMKNEKADIYINPCFTDGEKYAEAVKELNIFEKVTVISPDLKYKFFGNNRLLTPLRVIKSYVFPSKIATHFFIKDRIYKKIYSTNKDLYGRIIMFYLLRKNHDVEMNSFEEGDASYFAEVSNVLTPYDRLFRRLLYGKRSLMVNSLYLHSPELYHLLNPTSAMVIKKLVFNYPLLQKLMHIMYPEDCTYSIKERAVILDTHQSLLFNEKEKHQLADIYQYFFSSLGKNNTILKKHPRENSVNNKDWNYFPSNSLPFEMLCKNSDINNRIIITYISSAAINIKTILNQEPYIIFLYKLVKFDADRTPLRLSRMDELCKGLSRLYTQENKVMIPSTLIDLHRCLDKINDLS